jgi:hypothetical protein
LFTGVINLVQDAAAFRAAVTARCAGTAGFKIVRIAIDKSIVNVVFWLTVIIEEAIFEWFSVVTNLSSTNTGNKIEASKRLDSLQLQ